MRPRLLAGILVSGGLLLVTLLLIAPLANLGVFALESSYTSDILAQLIVTFAIWAVSWAILATPSEAAVTADGERLSRRSAIRAVGWSAAGLAAAAAVAGSLRSMFAPPSSAPRATTIVNGVEATQEPQSADSIVATQRSGQLTATAESAAVAEEPLEVAELQSDQVAPEPSPEDPFAFYNQLEAEGKLTPVLTETDDFYHGSKNFSDPTVSAEGWTLRIDGLVTTPLELTYEQLAQRAMTDKITTLCCISNDLNGDLVGTALWTGVPLAELLAEAGVAPGVIDLKLYAADDYTESIPLDVAMDPDTLVVTGMNGETLRDDHGFPARLIVPPIYGMKNVKWLNRIEAVAEDYKGYWQERGWSDPAIYQIWGRIDFPLRDGLKARPAVAAGVASAGDRGISRVEVSVDDRETWADAQLEPSLNPPFTWVRWAFPFEAVPGEHKIWMRATDGTGQLMIEKEEPPLPDGATGWPMRWFDVE